MTNKEFLREELYSLVWSKPLTKLAREYQISDNGLRKICKKHNIPLPVLGHWQKLKYGKKVTTIPLPAIEGKTQKIKLTNRHNDNGETKHYLSEYYLLKKAIENDRSICLKVPKRLSKPDKLIIEAKKKLEHLKTRPSYYHKGIISTSGDNIIISVSKKMSPGPWVSWIA